MPVETRFYRSDQHTVNGLTAYKLLLEKSGVGRTFGYARAGAYLAGNLGIRVWKRDSTGAETEVTGGSPVAVVTFVDGDFHVEESATWNCPQTALNPTDCVVVRVYARIPAGSGTWTLMTGAVFATEQLGAQCLDASTWTVYYVGSFTYNVSLNRAGIEFHVDGNDNSRIGGFAWTLYVPPVIAKIAYTDGLVCIA